jgi:hypothetical protein
MMPYMPIVRTRAAELRGLRELTAPVKDAIVPVVELTRSRRSSKNPGGDVQKSIDALLEILGNRPFVADLTSLASQQNGEFGQLLNDAGAFQAWTDFVSQRLPPTCVPIVHLLDPFDEAEFRTQVARLLGVFRQVAVRIPTSYMDLPAVIAAFQADLGSLDQVVMVLDAGYVTGKTVQGAIGRLSEMIGNLHGHFPASLSIASSSFPNSVTNAGGGDEQGELMLVEVAIGAELAPLRADLRYGDYAAIHPLDFMGMVVNWVPRVDVMLDDRFYYHRHRRTAGGYIRAAAEARRDQRWRPLQCWAQENIDAAAAGAAKGLSPSFWISNRVNFHISRQVVRLSR